MLRVLGELDPEGRMARLLIEVPDPLRGATPLLVGAFVDVKLVGRELRDTIAVPRAALVGSNAVWRVRDDQSLEKAALTVAWRGNNAIYVRNGSGGLNAGDRIVKTRIPLAVEGMHARIEHCHSETPSAHGQLSGTSMQLPLSLVNRIAFVHHAPRLLPTRTLTTL